MSVYGYLVLRRGRSEPGLRMIGLVGVLGLAAGVWALGRNPRQSEGRRFGRSAVVAGPSMLRRAPSISVTSLQRFARVVRGDRMAGVRESRPPSYRLLWVVPLALTAFYLRYQSILSLALIGVVVLGLWWPKVRHRPGPVVAVVLIGIIGLIPHLIEAVDLTGKTMGDTHLHRWHRRARLRWAGPCRLRQSVAVVALRPNWPIRHPCKPRWTCSFLEGSGSTSALPLSPRCQPFYRSSPWDCSLMVSRDSYSSRSLSHSSPPPSQWTHGCRSREDVGRLQLQLAWP